METFVVRIWLTTERGLATQLRGTVQRVATGERVTFTDADGLVSYLVLASEASTRAQP